MCFVLGPEGGGTTGGGASLPRPVRLPRVPSAGGAGPEAARTPPPAEAPHTNPSSTSAGLAEGHVSVTWAARRAPGASAGLPAPSAAHAHARARPAHVGAPLPQLPPSRRPSEGLRPRALPPRSPRVAPLSPAGPATRPGSPLTSRAGPGRSGRRRPRGHLRPPPRTGSSALRRRKLHSGAAALPGGSPPLAPPLPAAAAAPSGPLLPPVEAHGAGRSRRHLVVTAAAQEGGKARRAASRRGGGCPQRLPSRPRDLGGLPRAAPAQRCSPPPACAHALLRADHDPRAPAPHLSPGFQGPEACRRAVQTTRFPRAHL